MILADIDIPYFRELGLLDIQPWDDKRIQPGSYDLTLAPYVTHIAPTTWTPEFSEPEPRPWTEKFEEATFVDGTRGLVYSLAPGEFALFTTVETVTLSAGICGLVAGKSTHARRGLSIEMAGWVDPGFRGQITLELKNLTDDYIGLVAGEPIAQIVFMEMRRPALRPYGSPGLGSKYQNQEGPTAAR